MSTHPNFQSATSADAAFAFAVEEDAMRAYAEQTWGRWAPSNDREGFIAGFRPAGQQVIVAEGRRVGILAVDRRADHLFVAKLYILAPYRNAGIGSQVIGAVLADAQARRMPVKLRVLSVNTRAKAFYERHGFRVDHEDNERTHMVAEPAQPNER